MSRDYIQSTIHGSNATLAPNINNLKGERLAPLVAFATEVWGNETIFRTKCQHQSGSTTRTVDYLDFDQHFDAVQSFCPALESRKLLVVQEYRDAMAEFRRESFPPRNRSTYARGACIVGQPGIGKSCFIAYAVTERLREKQPVAIQVSWGGNVQLYLFLSENSATLHENIETEPLKDCSPAIWAFSDSGPHALIPMSAFTDTLGVRVFQTTSPALRRHKEWTKTGRVNRYIMDLWSMEEIEDFAFLLELDVQIIHDLAADWGRVPRILLENCSNPVLKAAHERKIMSVIESTAETPNFARAIANLENLDIDPGSSTIFFVKPHVKDNVVSRIDHSIYVPTRWIFNLLAKEIMRQTEEKKLDFFKTMSSHSQTRSAAGCLYEEIVHRFLVRGNAISIDWCQEDIMESLTLPILEARSVNADFNRPGHFYWRPAKPNHRGIDGAIVTYDCVYPMQITISSRHSDPQRGIDDLWNRMPSEKKGLKWKFLFVGPSEDQTKALSMRYSSKLKIGNGRRQKTLPVGRVSILPGDYSDLPLDIDYEPEMAPSA